MRLPDAPEPGLSSLCPHSSHRGLAGGALCPTLSLRWCRGGCNKDCGIRENDKDPDAGSGGRGGTVAFAEDVSMASAP